VNVRGTEISRDRRSCLYKILPIVSNSIWWWCIWFTWLLFSWV